MRVLIVDDVGSKIDRIRTLTLEILEGEQFEIAVAQTANEAVRLLRDGHFDLLILDLNLPMRVGQLPKADAGLEILRAVRERSAIRRPRHIIGLSAYPELIALHESEFAKETWFLLQYRDDSDEWAQLLGRKLLHIVESEHPEQTDLFGKDVAIVTALHAIELESVLALPGRWQTQRFAGDDTVYHTGGFDREPHHLDVVAAACPEMGMPAATALSMKMIERFRPRVLAIVGIAAGVVGDFGDILIADQSWDYGSGKTARGSNGRSRFMPAPSAIPLSPALKARVQLFNMNSGVLRRIQDAWTQQPQPRSVLRAHIGPVASGASVVEDPSIVKGIHQHNRKLIGIEMETYGVFLAAMQCCAPRPKAFSVKSICDFADSNKDDNYQVYAAHTSSNYLYEFALQELTTDRA